VTDRAIRPGDSWRLLPINRIEDLQDAVYGAGLEAVQMSRGRLGGSLAFVERDGILYGSGLIGGRVALSGPLSQDMVTFGLGLRIPNGTWHWYEEVSTGSIGAFLPGDEHDSLYMPGSLYATATMSLERLTQAAAREELVLDRKTLGGTGFQSLKVSPALVAPIARQMEQVHSGQPATGRLGPPSAERLLRIVINRYARPPRPIVAQPCPSGHARIVARARVYALEHLHQPISIEAMAAAAFASPRTLYRAFLAILDETPHAYVRRLRLHRIRHELIGEAEAACTIAMAANLWGIGELGRFAGMYRELFGELPSETLRHGRRQAIAA
jgi:AraC-like DNA-binding protein